MTQLLLPCMKTRLILGAAVQQPEAAGAKVQQRFDNLNYNDIKKGKQLNFLRVSCGKLERFRSFVCDGETGTPLFSKNANL
mgnify:CR=1 FL=1